MAIKEEKPGNRTRLLSEKLGFSEPKVSEGRDRCSTDHGLDAVGFGAFLMRLQGSSVGKPHYTAAELVP